MMKRVIEYIVMVVVLTAVAISSLTAQQTKMDIRQIKTLPTDHFLTSNGTTNITLERTAANIKYNPADGTWSVDDVKEGLDGLRSAVTALQAGGSDGVIESAAFTGTGTKTLTIERSVGADLTANFTDLVDDADASVTNELQTIAATGTTTAIVTLSNSGGAFTIAGGGGNAISRSGSTFTITAPTNLDNSVTNEAQTITAGGTTSPTVSLNQVGGAGGGTITYAASGATSLSRTGNTITITSTDNVNDADASVTNEIQTLSANATNNTITASLSGGTVDRNDQVTEFAFKPTSGTTITLPNAPPAGTHWVISLNGIVQRRTAVAADTPDINVSGTTVTFNYWTFSAGDVVTGTVGK